MEDLSLTPTDDSASQSQDEVYVFVKFLGSGSFGRVNLYRNTSDNSLVVWKEIDLKKLDHKYRSEAFSEVEILSILSHPNIITYYKYFIGDDTLYIELEYAKTGNLTTQIKAQKQSGQYFEQEVIIWYLYQLCSAVEYIHDIGIMHRDIKTLNIFLMQSGLLKLGDFGIAKILDSSGMLETQVGSPFYMSPEIIEGKKYSIKSDIWALGCVAYELLTLNKVFDATNQLKLAIKISECNISEIEISEYNDDIKSLVKKILSKDPSARPTAKEILNNNSLFSSRKESFSARIDQLNLNSKKNRFMTTNSESNILISTQTANINQVNNLSNTFSTLNVQSPRITSKLCEVWSWGGGRITPKQIEYFNKYNAPLHVALSPDHYAVITVEKELFTWGVSSAGGINVTNCNSKLGHGKHFGFTRSPKRVESLSGISITQVGLTNTVTLCVSEEGDLYAFGSNVEKCLGMKNTTEKKIENLDESENLYIPTKLSYFSEKSLKIAKLACGDAHVIVLTDTNQIFVWGVGEYGRLGLGDELDRDEPTEIKFNFNYTFKNVFAGSDCTFILTKEGKVLAFGNNEYNKLCLNSNSIDFKNSQNTQKCVQNLSTVSQQLTPKIIKYISQYNVTKVCSGESHTVVLDSFGRLFSFGSNKFGQLGVGDFREHPGLNIVGNNLLGQNVTNVACGDSFTICSTSENLVFSWGCSKNGRLGIETSLGNEANVCLPKPLFGSLAYVSEMSAKHWNSIIIAEQIIDEKSLKSLSYADYMRKTNTKLFVENEATNCERPFEDLSLKEQLKNIENNEKLLESKQIQDFNADKNELIKENRNSPENSQTGVPDWLKKDLEDAEFIPIEAFKKNEPISQNVSIGKDRNIKDLNQAIEIIRQLEIENSRLLYENKQLQERMAVLEQNSN